MNPDSLDVTGRKKQEGGALLLHSLPIWGSGRRSLNALASECREEEVFDIALDMNQKDAVEAMPHLQLHVKPKTEPLALSITGRLTVSF
ncbi:MAG: hypothetical protein KDK40_00870 [Chlamydiia bacterium]|nr:hypothetical protein [Chlamydiia bacterium]